MANTPESDLPSETPSTESNAGDRSADIQQAVETFIENHTSGNAVDPMKFAAGYRESLRSQILAQCREFLVFDGMLGQQEWSDPSAETTDGKTFGEFVIQEELGRGGMGVVYLANQKSLNRRVALKVMASGLTLSKRHVERFRHEAMATAKLRHPAIVGVHGLVEVDGTFALAMDYVAGRNLADILDDLRLANSDGQGVVIGTLGIASHHSYVAECAMLVSQIASALAAAHHSQIVHRDLKPRNLMIDERQQVRLLDFGLAKSLDATRQSISMPGEINGTAHYMSPEQTLAKRVEIDHRSDIWSLGVILYELLTLKRPFDGKNLQQIVYGICFKEPPSPQRLNTKVPRDLETICQKALEKDPSNRYQTAVEFEADLQRFLRWEPIHAKPASALTRATKFLRRHRTESLATATTLLVTTTLLSAIWISNSIDASTADGLLKSAEIRAGEGDFKSAIALTTEALELRNDEVTRERLERYYSESKRVSTESAWKVAESKQLLNRDREAALQLALGAEQILPSVKTRSAVLDALGSGWMVQTLLPESPQRPSFASFSSSGNKIVAGGQRGSLQLINRNSQAAPRQLVGHDEQVPIAGAAFINDQDIVSVSIDQTLRLWRAEANYRPQTIDLGEQIAAALYVSAASNRALILTYNRQLRQYQAQVRNTDDGTLVTNPIEHQSLIWVAGISPNGQVVATCSGAQSIVRLNNASDGSSIADIAMHAPKVSARCVAFSADSSMLAIGHSDGFVGIYDTATGAIIGQARHSRRITSIAFDQTNSRLLTGSQDQTARLWQLDRKTAHFELREIGILMGHKGPVEHVSFNATGELAVTTTNATDGVIRIYDVGVGRAPASEAIYSYEVGETVKQAAFARDSRCILAVTSKRTLLWQYGTAQGVVTLRQPGKVPSAAFTSDGEYIVTAGDDEKLRFWNSRNGRQVWKNEQLRKPITGLDIDDNNQHVACSDTDGVVHIHAIETGKQLFTLGEKSQRIATVKFVQAGRQLLTISDTDNAQITLWNLADKTETHCTRPTKIIAADINQDGSLLATVENEEHFARLWKLPALTPLGEVGEHSAAIVQIQFAKDSSRLLTASLDQSIRAYRLADGRCITKSTVGSPFQFATFSPDGQLLLTYKKKSGTAHLWNANDGSEVLHFSAQRGALRWGTINNNGTWAATCADDGTTCIWPTNPVEVATALRSQNESNRLPSSEPR